MEDGKSGAPTVVCASGMVAVLDGEHARRGRTSSLTLHSRCDEASNGESRRLEPGGVPGLPGALGLARRLVGCAREPMALVTRSHVVFANGAFCRWAGIAVGSRTATPLSTFFGVDEQALLFDSDGEAQGHMQEGAWIELPWPGPHGAWVEARALRIEEGDRPHWHWLLSLAEPALGAVGEQAMSRLSHWAAIGLSASGAPTLSSAVMERGEDPSQCALSPPVALRRAAAAQDRSPWPGHDGQLKASGAVDVNRLVMCAVEAERLPGDCRIICQLEPLPWVTLDGAQLLLALRFLLEHVASTFLASRRPGSPFELWVRSERGEQGLRVWAQARCAASQGSSPPPPAAGGTLALAQRALQALGGWLQVELLSSGCLEYGAHIPWTPVSEAPSRGAELRPSGTMVQRPALRLLIVEPDPEVAMHLRRALRPLGQVDTVSDGQAAISLLTLDEHFDAILCDEPMADGTGVQVCRWLAAYRPSLLSRLLLMRQREAAAAAPPGVVTLHKPVDFLAVRQVVSAWLNSAAAAASEPMGGFLG